MKEKAKTMKIQDLSTDVTEKFGFNDRLAMLITQNLGSMIAVYACIAFMGFWMFVGYETYEDPYPFPLLLLIINMVILILLPLIMVGQNLINKKEQVRANQALDATMSSYENILTILECLDSHEKELSDQTKILNKLLKSSGKDSQELLYQTKALTMLLESSENHFRKNETRKKALKKEGHKKIN